jgi:ABC-2 type transport system ATP-binding protein
MEYIIEANHIVKQYANHTALNDISIQVPKGKIFGLLGPNGAGKTSLIRIINQITAPDSGTILFNGEKLNPSHIERIGYLPEERGLYKKMKVGEQALYLAQLKGLNKKDALKKLKFWFEHFQIQAWWDKKIEELSKGMAQKVQFIVTILHEPELLILDEPFSGFDPINAEIIKQEILFLKEKGTTIIFSTHNMGSVEELCDYIALINKSRCILSGSVKEIKNTYRTNTYKINFKGNILSFANVLWAGAELLHHEVHDDNIEAEVKLLHHNTLNDLLKAVIPHVEIQSVTEVIPSMNDIFIQKVNETSNIH